MASGGRGGEGKKKPQNGAGRLEGGVVVVVGIRGCNLAIKIARQVFRPKNDPFGV